MTELRRCAEGSEAATSRVDEVTLTIDGIEVTAPKGALVIRVAEQLGIEIPRFCDHPLLDPAGACRQCLVDVEGQRKPVASCTQTVADGMVVRTQLTSPVAQEGAGGRHGAPPDQPPARLPDVRQGRRVPAAEPGHVHRPGGQPVPRRQADLPQARQHLHPGAAGPGAVHPVHPLRPVLRAVAGDPFIEFMDRTSAEQVNVYRDEFFGGEPGGDSAATAGTSRSSPTSRATPSRSARSGALTSVQYRFRARPFDLVSCRACASTARPGAPSARTTGAAR